MTLEFGLGYKTLALGAFQFVQSYRYFIFSMALEFHLSYTVVFGAQREMAG